MRTRNLIIFTLTSACIHFSKLKAWLFSRVDEEAAQHSPALTYPRRERAPAPECRKFYLQSHLHLASTPGKAKAMDATSEQELLTLGLGQHTPVLAGLMKTLVSLAVEIGRSFRHVSAAVNQFQCRNHWLHSDMPVSLLFSHYQSRLCKQHIHYQCLIILIEPFYQGN